MLSLLILNVHDYANGTNAQRKTVARLACKLAQMFSKKTAKRHLSNRCSIVANRLNWKQFDLIR